MSSSDLARRLVGTWWLRAYEAQDAAGTVRHPLGQDPIGCLVYSSDGCVSVQIARPNRARFPTGDVSSASVAQLAAAADGYLAYAGTYNVDEEAMTVTHHVRVSLVPNWIGTSQRREVDMDGDVLVLIGGPVRVGGVRQVPRLTWRRGPCDSDGAETRR